MKTKSSWSTIIGLAAIFLLIMPRSPDIPIGVIVMWSGNRVPAGWALCDGSQGTPDLRDRFIVGSGGGYQVGDIGGQATTVHDHSFNGNMRQALAGPVWYATATHTEPVGIDNRPPYYALAFIMKISVVSLPLVR